MAKEFSDCKNHDLGAANPSTEGLAMPLPSLASGKGTQCLIYVVASRASFYAQAIRHVLMEFPKEDRNGDDKDIVGELQYLMCGTRDAAQNGPDS